MGMVGTIQRALRALAVGGLGLTGFLLGHGCAKTQYQAQAEATKRGGSARETRPAGRAKSPRRAKAADQSDDRHPSRWKRKLKAYYAQDKQREKPRSTGRTSVS